jgi:heavy metal efflux system protein
MFNHLIKISIKYRYFVLITTIFVSILGLVLYSDLNIDAVPDITNIQVQINSKAEGYSPLEVEQRITIPIEKFLSGIPQLDYIRSISRYGLSQITIIFKDGTDIYFARQLISQRLQESMDNLPVGINPSMGPIATGLGEIYMYSLKRENKSVSLQDLREAQDWIVTPQLRTLPGVIEVNSIGGKSKQIIINPDLNKLKAYELTLDDIEFAIVKNNSNVGAGYLEQNGEQYLIRVPAQLKKISQIKKLVIGIHEGITIKLDDVANIIIGSSLRSGVAIKNASEVVLGTVFMLVGENGRQVSNSVTNKLSQISRNLPKGIKLETVYNRANLINSTISTVRKNLLEGAILVILILFLTLGNIKAALVTACVIPLSMLITIIGMTQNHISANLMSLGALDFGLIVDGAVILVENCVKKIASFQKSTGRLLTTDERLDLVYKSSVEVRQATIFGELIIMVVYIPILALSGIEGKMYHPMAITVIFALASAMLLSLTFIPASIAIFIKGEVKDHGVRFLKLQNFYKFILTNLCKVPLLVVIISLLFIVSSILISRRLGSEFIPTLDEGDIALHALRIPGTSLTQAIKMQYNLEAKIQKMPEVSHVFSSIGTAEIASDPMPPNVADGFIILKPRSLWPNPAKAKSEVVNDLEKIVKKVPGNNYEFIQPIQMRFNELIAGVRSDLAVKIFGDDTDTLVEIGKQVEAIMSKIKGVSDIKLEQTTGLPMLIINPDRNKLAKYGLNASNVQDIVSTLYSGKEVSKFYNGDRNYPITIRLDEINRNNPDYILKVPLAIPNFNLSYPNTVAMERFTIKEEPEGARYITLNEIAKVDLVEGPNQISRENGKRRIVVTANVRERDLGSFVAEAQLQINKKLDLPPSYWLNWGGQFENLISAKNRLMIVVPLVLFLVFGLIFTTFKSIKYSLLIFTGIPFALTGGILALWIRSIPFSISAAVGFIALSGVSVLNGLVLVSFIKSQIQSSNSSIVNDVIEGAISRLRPVMMTALVASLGFVPMAISQGIGSEVQRPLATVVIGGIVSSTLLTLFVLPVLITMVIRKK